MEVGGETEKIDRVGMAVWGILNANDADMVFQKQNKTL